MTMLVLACFGALLALGSPGSAAFIRQSFSPLAIGSTIATLLSIVSAANTIQFINYCPYDLFYWTVGPKGSGYDGKDYEALTILANSISYHGMVNTQALGGGIALKLRDIPKYEVAPAGILQVEYNLEPSTNSIWYDLSAIDCNHVLGPESPSFCPLIGGGIKVYVPGAHEGNCPPAWCGAEGCHSVYTKHGSWKGEPTFRCDAGVDVVVEICTERPGPRTFNRNHKVPKSDDPYPKTMAGKVTKDGRCGAQSELGATCFGYGHSNCCSGTYLFSYRSQKPKS
jgi:hypothetical protein